MDRKDISDGLEWVEAVAESVYDWDGRSIGETGDVGMGTNTGNHAGNHRGDDDGSVIERLVYL